jgi:hypothetical protein
VRYFSCGFFVLLIAFSLSVVASENYDSNYKLIEAVENENIYQVEDLLSKGLNPNVVDEFRRTPLMIAAYKGNYKIAKLLLRNGANISIQDSGGATALHYAVRAEAASLSTLLIENGANPNTKDKNGITPLRIAKALNIDEIIDVMQIDVNHVNQNSVVEKQETHFLDDGKYPIQKSNDHKSKKPSSGKIKVGEAIIAKDDYKPNPHYTFEDIEKPKAKAVVCVDGFSDMNELCDFWDDVCGKYNNLDYTVKIYDEENFQFKAQNFHDHTQEGDFSEYAKAKNLNCRKLYE